MKVIAPLVKRAVPAIMSVLVSIAFAHAAAAGTKEQMKMLMSQDQHKYALQNLEARIRHNPRDAEALYLRAQWHCKGIEFEEALRDISFALRVKEKPEYYRLRGETYQHLNRFDESVADFNKAISLKKSADFYQGRAKSYRYKGDTTNALKDTNEAIKLDPTEPDNYEERAEIYRDQKKYKLAIDDMKKAMQLGIPTRRRLLVLGDLQMESHDYAGAVDSYDRVTKKDPKNLKAYRAKMNACQKAGMKAEAAAVEKRLKALEEEILGH